MALDDDIRVLKGVALFEGFSPDQLRFLAFGAERVRVAAGQDIYQEDVPADEAYAVASGRITLFRKGKAGRALLGSVGPGALLGELALISGSPRLTGASAETDAELIRLGRVQFRRILEEYPELAAMLHRRISADMLRLIDQIAGISERFAG